MSDRVQAALDRWYRDGGSPESTRALRAAYGDRIADRKRRPLERRCEWLTSSGTPVYSTEAPRDIGGVVYVYTYSAKTCRGLGFRPLNHLTPATAREAA